MQTPALAHEETSRPVRPRPAPRWWVELGLVVVAYAAYAHIRNEQGEDTSPPAFAHALHHSRQVIGAEHALGVGHELGVQRFVLALGPLMHVFDVLYATLHVPVTLGVLVWLFVRRPASYHRARNALLLGTAVSLLVFWAYPTAPPRLVPGGGYVDTLLKVGGVWSFRTPAIERIADPFAAMPSLHLVWATWCGLAVLANTRRIAPRIAFAVYPALVTAVVLATGNHFLLDAVAGAALGLAGWWLAGGLERAGARRRERHGAPASSPGGDDRIRCAP